MRNTKQTGEAAGAGRAARAGGWATVYLLAAGTLIAVAGSGLSRPSADERARSLERETARELASVVEMASGLARSQAEEGLRRASRRRATLEAALAAARSWARQLESRTDQAEVEAELSRAADGLLTLLPEGVGAAVLAPSGERLFEAGGAVDIDSPEALTAPAGGSLTVAVAWAGDAAPRESELAGALRGTLGPGLEPGTGLYFVAADGLVAAEVSPRPMPEMPPGAPLARGLVKTVTGDRETGRLVCARRAVALGGGRPKLTAVAERLLSPEALAGGANGLAGTLALAGLGVIAAAAFAHVCWSGYAKPAARADSASPVPVGAIPRRSPREAEPVPVPEAEPGYSAPSGRSIIRLRESLGASARGPDLAACARSPILRALSRCVRHPTPAFVPREVKEWARRAFGEEEDRGKKVA